MILEETKLEIETEELGKITLSVKTAVCTGKPTFGIPHYYTEITQAEDEAQKEKRRNERETHGREPPRLISYGCHYYKLQEAMEGHSEIIEAIRNGQYKLFPHAYLFAVPIPSSVKGKYPSTNNDPLFENLPARKESEKSGYKRIKRHGGGVTYTRRKKPLKPIKKKRKSLNS